MSTASMSLRYLRAFALTALVFLLGNLGCGYILYPERRGNRGGVIDGGTLVMDLLWLLPGIVPGVIFLIVDFTSGAMYVNGRVAMNVTPTGNLALQLEDSTEAKTLRLRVVSASQKVIDDRTVQIGPDRKNQVVQLHVGTAAQRSADKVFVHILDAKAPRTTILQTVQIP